MRKKSFILFFLISLFFILHIPVLAGEKIKSFDLQAEINLDGSVDLTETIIYDFGSELRHGIERTIPLAKKNEEGKTFLLDFKLNSITNEFNETLTYIDQSTQKEAKFRIGDADKTISGIHTYMIDYMLKGALAYFDDHDEFYWNVNGTDWPVSSKKVTATVELPSSINLV